MLDTPTRATILKLHEQKVSLRQIARLLKISRNSVRKVLASGSPAPPPTERAQKAEPWHDEILILHQRCRGNLVRVHEELRAQGAEISYPALTAFCRRHGIGRKPIRPVGRYHFEPGQEIQHDTSPHLVELSGKKRRVQTASAVLACSRMMFFQCYPRFRRFDCKVFLTDALTYFGGAPQVVMIDNTHLVVLSGTGRQMVPVPEMAAFAERYGFRFRAHAVGDANRSARVERPFHYIETNFLAGRKFGDWQELNQAARAWCDRVNASYKRHLKAKPVELFAHESTRLRPLPLWVPEPDRIAHRTVDVYGYVSLDTNRYSVPTDWIGRPVQVRETKSRVEITLGRQSVDHPRILGLGDQRSTLPEHRSPRRPHPRRQPPPERAILLKRVPEIAGYIEALGKHGKKPPVLALRCLLRMVREYPQEPLLDAVHQAHHYGLYDLDRLETMVLQRIAEDFFPFHHTGDPHER